MRVAILMLFCACGSNIVSINEEKLTEAELLTKWNVAPAPLGDYFAVHGSSAQDVFIVGRGGKILHYTGEDMRADAPSPETLFVDMPSPTTENLFVVYCVSPTRAFAAGAHGTIIAWDGTAWSLEVSNTTKEIRGLWADELSALAVGADATALARAQGVWSAVPTDSPDDLFALVKGNGNPFAVGTLGTISTFNGTGFTRRALAGYPRTLVAATAGPGGTFIGGVDGAVFDRDRGNARLAGIQASFVRGIAAPGGDAIFVVGWDGLLAKVPNGAAPIPYTDAGRTWLYGIWAADPLTIWVVGADGLILRGPPPVDPVVAP